MRSVRHGTAGVQRVCSAAIFVVVLFGGPGARADEATSPRPTASQGEQDQAYGLSPADTGIFLATAHAPQTPTSEQTAFQS